MRGMLQTLFQRAISSGLYFPLEDIFHQEIIDKFGNKKEYRSFQNFAAGTLAGCLNAILMNPSSSVKVSLSICAMICVDNTFLE
jgi:hypothetical protein